MVALSGKPHSPRYLQSPYAYFLLARTVPDGHPGLRMLENADFSWSQNQGSVCMEGETRFWQTQTHMNISECT